MRQVSVGLFPRGLAARYYRLFVDGVPSIESDELASACARMASLEAELASTRDACALFDDQSVEPPKGRS